MGIKLKLIVAASENMGIGKNGELPWQLRKEMAYFSRLTSTTKDDTRKNVVVMGKKTWESIPTKFKPLRNRINFVLSRSDLNFEQYKDTFAFKSLQQAFDKLKDTSFEEKYEDVWIIGGSSLYKEILNSPYSYRLYLTKIHKHFDCDTFLPTLPENLKKVSEPGIPEEIQEENGIEYSYHIYETC